MSYQSNDTVILPVKCSEANLHGRDDTSLLKNIFEHISTVSHTLIFGFVGFIIFLCFQNKFVFFTSHPLLYTIGWACLMMEAILVLAPDNIFSKRFSFKLRVKYHWLIQLLAVSCCTGGFFIDFINKNRNNRPHFKSTHGLVGVIAMGCLIPTCINGIAALFNIELNKFIKPSINKLIHAICGMITFVLGSTTMILGFYTWWFETKTGKASQIFCSTIIAFTTVWCLLRPLVTAINRIK